MTTLAYAINEIVLGSGDDLRTIVPAKVFDAGDQFDELLGLGAVREPTDAEVALYEATTGKATKVAATKAETSKTPAPAGKSAETDKLVG